MNIGTIITPNTKGQVVIPKKMRDQLNITENTSLNITNDGRTIYINLIKEVVVISDYNNDKLLEVLKKTQGVWADEDWGTYDKEQREKRKIEIQATLRNKRAW